MQRRLLIILLAALGAVSPSYAQQVPQSISDALRARVAGARPAAGQRQTPETEQQPQTGLLPEQPTGPTSTNLQTLTIPEHMPLQEGPIDPNQYVLGPGDVLAVTIQGAFSTAEELPIAPDGSVLVPGAGVVQVAEMTLARGCEAVRQEVLHAFKNVQVSVMLVTLRRFTVHVIGQVAQPGDYDLSAVDRVSTAIDRAGGVLTGASQRVVRVQRRNGVTIISDLLLFRRAGDLSANPTLLGGDVINVGFPNAGIMLSGEVQVPGIYEYVEGDSLGGLIALAGGLTDQAVLDTVEIGRYVEGSDRPRMINVTSGAAGGRAGLMRYPLQLRDAVLIRTLPHWNVRKTIKIDGEVVYPGTYVIDEGRTTLTDVIRRAGGFTDEASLREASLMRANDNTAKDQEFARLQTMLPTEMSHDEYDYFKMRSRQRSGLMAVDFVRLFQQNDATQNTLLKDGNQVLVPPKKGWVTLAGQVAFPGNLTYEPGLGVADYVQRAGGFGWNASPGRTKVIRAATGEWVAGSKVVRLGPGDTIWVPEKPEHEWYATFKDAVVTVSQLATIYLVIHTATK